MAFKWTRFQTFCQKLSYDEQLVRKNILCGEWREGVHWLVAPDGEVFIHRDAPSKFRKRPHDQYSMVFHAPLDLRLPGIDVASMPRVPGVYLLFKGPDVQYVGQSRHLSSRIRKHLSQKTKDFDSIGWITCDPSQLNRIERAYIYLVQPPLNQKGKN